MIVAGLLWNLVGDGPAGGLEVEHKDLRLQQRRVDPLSFARLLALKERHHNAERAEQSRGQIRNRDADAHRALARQAGDGHQAAHSLGNLVEARTITIWDRLAE